MGLFDRQPAPGVTSAQVIQPYTFEARHGEDGQPLVGSAAWHSQYNPAAGWKSFTLGKMVGCFVDGGANFLTAVGLPLRYSVAVVAVLVACFATTTLDTATRLQRYVIQELAGALHIRPLSNKYLATLFAVALAMVLAMMRGPAGPDGTPGAHGYGGLYLWPLFGAINQLLAGLAFMVTAFYLWRRKKPIWFLVPSMILMIVMPAWALIWQMFNGATGWYHTGSRLLFGIGAITLLLQVWMVVEGVLIWPRARGVLEQALPPLPPRVETVPT
jgi:carbon starvation protein